MEKVVEVDNVSKKFGGLKALDNVRLYIKQGEIYGLIGPNGSGKTTLINLISGFYAPDRGMIKIQGVRVDGLPPYAKGYESLARTFQIPKLWSRLSVIQNLYLAGYAKIRNAKETDIRERVKEFLDSFDINKISELSASKVSGGQAKLIEFGRAMVSAAKIILLDEPFAGVAPHLVARQIEWIKMRKTQGTSFLVTSHIISTLAAVCDRLGVMHEGRLIAEGQPEEVLRSKQVIQAYLGGFHVSSS